MECILNFTEEEVRYLVDLLDDRNYYLFKRNSLLGVSSQKTIEYRRVMIDREEKLIKSIYDKI